MSLKERDVHFKVTPEEREYMFRVAHNVHAKVSQITRQKWFGPGWKLKLEDLRLTQRDAGLSDKLFSPISKAKWMNGKKK